MLPLSENYIRGLGEVHAVKSCFKLVLNLSTEEPRACGRTVQVQQESRDPPVSGDIRLKLGLRVLTDRHT